jgi:hypothetical protein
LVGVNDGVCVGVFVLVGVSVGVLVLVGVNDLVGVEVGVNVVVLVGVNVGNCTTVLPPPPPSPAAVAHQEQFVVDVELFTILVTIYIDEGAGLNSGVDWT